MSNKPKTLLTLKKTHQKKLSQDDYNNEIANAELMDNLISTGSIQGLQADKLKTGAGGTKYNSVKSKVKAETYVLNSNTTSTNYFVSVLLPDVHKAGTDFEKSANAQFVKHNFVVYDDKTKEHKQVKAYVSYIMGATIPNFKGDVAGVKVEKELVKSSEATK